MADDEITVTVPVPEPLDVVPTPDAAPLVVVVEDSENSSADPIIGEVIDLAVSDALKDAEIADLHDRIASLEQAALLNAEATSLALQAASANEEAIDELANPASTEADEAPRREHGFWRTVGSRD